MSSQRSGIIIISLRKSLKHHGKTVEEKDMVLDQGIVVEIENN